MGSWVMRSDKSDKGPLEDDVGEHEGDDEDASSAISEDENDDPFEAVESPKDVDDEEPLLYASSS